MNCLGFQLGRRVQDVQSWNSFLDIVRAWLVRWQSKYLSLGSRLVLI